jgi:sterol desaturase/sphingolipid hydroxylase (fatty acid hydroxylase superfamily)
MRVAGALGAGAVALAILIAERLMPLRKQGSARRVRRRAHNVALGAAAGLVQLALVGPVACRVARWRRERGLAAVLAPPGAARDALAFALLDYAMYLWHRQNHQVPALFRFHAVHHSDPDLDASTAARFHPGEIALSALAAAVAVLVVAPRPEVVIRYGWVMQLAALFHHADLRLPVRLERALAHAVVTPRMHNVHHSIVDAETSSNWSTVFSVWDLLHRTWREPAVRTELGLPGASNDRERSLADLASMPFRPAIG